jgi:hypothetical protein
MRIVAVLPVVVVLVVCTAIIYTNTKMVTYGHGEMHVYIDLYAHDYSLPPRGFKAEVGPVLLCKTADSFVWGRGTD